MMECTNCLSEARFANLIFLNVQIQGVEATALFDTGANLTVIAESLLKQCRPDAGGDSLRCGNNNGVVRELRTARLADLQIADRHVKDLRVLVAQDADFAITDTDGTPFPARILLGWDVISRVSWHYTEKPRQLLIGEPECGVRLGNLTHSRFPVLTAEWDRRTFRAGLDTGHTDTILGAVWKERLPTKMRSASTVGFGSREETELPYTDSFSFRIGDTPFFLRNLDIAETIFGADAETEVLFGMDVLSGCDWTLDGTGQTLRIVRT